MLGMGGYFLNVIQARPRILETDRNKSIVFDCNKNFVHALILTCAGRNVFFYYTKDHAVSFTAIFTHAIGNKLIF